MSNCSYELILIHMTRKIEKLAATLKVLGDPNRLGMVVSIGRNARSVTEIIKATGLSQTLVSFHLKALRNAGLVKTKRMGPFIYYSLADPALLDFLVDLSGTTNSGRHRRKEAPKLQRA